MSCPCSQLDWSEVDQTEEHHPECPTHAMAALGTAEYMRRNYPSNSQDQQIDRATAKYNGQHKSQRGSVEALRFYNDFRFIANALSSFDGEDFDDVIYMAKILRNSNNSFKRKE